METALVIKSEMQSCMVSNVLSTNSCIVWVKANIFIWSIPTVWQLMVSTPFPINTWVLLYTLSRPIRLKLKANCQNRPITNQPIQSWWLSCHCLWPKARSEHNCIGPYSWVWCSLQAASNIYKQAWNCERIRLNADGRKFHSNDSGQIQPQNMSGTSQAHIACPLSKC